MYRMHPMRWAWIGLGVLCLIFGSLWLFSASSRSRFYSEYYYGMPMMGWGGGWGMGLGIIGVVFACFLVMMAFRYMVWAPWGNRMGYWRGESLDAEEILRQRYARGEVTKEQFDQMLRDLREGRN